MAVSINDSALHKQATSSEINAINCQFVQTCRGNFDYYFFKLHSARTIYIDKK